MPQKRYLKDLRLRQPNMVMLRRMKAGEVVVFDSGTRKPGGMFNGAANAAGIASKLGMRITQRTMVLVDPVTYKATSVILVECLEECPDQQVTRGRNSHLKAKG